VDVHIQQKLRECFQYYQHVPLDLTFVSANNERENFQIDASGPYTDIQLPCSFSPTMVILNGSNRLNQARMDHEFMAYSDQSLFPILPYVDFRCSRENVVDSTLVRIEHIWAAPDQQPLGAGIFQLSDSHYYLVDGIWKPGDVFSGRVNYNGSQETDLDYNLYNVTEEQAVLAYRSSSEEPWEIYPDFTLGIGSLLNGDGFFTIDTLRRGQYAFANGELLAGLKPVDSATSTVLNCYPNPADAVLKVSGTHENNEVVFFDVYAANGRFVQRTAAKVFGSFEKLIDTSSLGDGAYVLQLSTPVGKAVGQVRFVVQH
jgi:hypothetical protein